MVYPSLQPAVTPIGHLNISFASTSWYHHYHPHHDHCRHNLHRHYHHCRQNYSTPSSRPSHPHVQAFQGLFASLPPNHFIRKHQLLSPLSSPLSSSSLFSGPLGHLIISFASATLVAEQLASWALSQHRPICICLHLHQNWAPAV